MTTANIDRIVIAPLAHLGGAIVSHEDELLLLINETLSQEQQERMREILLSKLPPAETLPLAA